jgi:hypothetical protein
VPGADPIEARAIGPILESPRRRRTDHSFASRSVPDHLRRGAIGFGGLLTGAWLWPRLGIAAVVPVVIGVIALRGCPMCWTIGLIQTFSWRYRRDCGEHGCALVEVDRPAPTRSRRTRLGTVRR